MRWRMTPRISRSELVGKAFSVGLTPGAADHLAQTFGHLPRTEHEIRKVRGFGVFGHAVELGRGCVLDQDHASRALDFRKSQAAVAARAGKHDADGVAALVLGQGAEKGIDGVAQAAFAAGREQAQGSVPELYVVVRRGDVDVVRLDSLAVFGLMHGNRGLPREQLAEQALLQRVHVRDHDQGVAGRRLEVFEKFLQRLQASGGSADAHDGKARRSGKAAHAGRGTGRGSRGTCLRIGTHERPPKVVLNRG
jgi:hypothetical protein